jgi:tetraprenyl-beta-curcumene synthase
MPKPVTAWPAAGVSLSVRTAELAHRSVRALLARSAFVGTVLFHAFVALPLARRELARWNRRAQAIADPALRERALATLRDESRNSEGAAAFAVLHPRAVRRLVPLLVAYQLAWDFVDTLLERPASATVDPEAVRSTLELALVLEGAGSPLPVASGAGDFLQDLVDACRTGCARLPRYAEAEPALRRVAARSDALLVTNGAPGGRMAALRVWARSNWVEGDELEPIELCAAAQCSLAVHALLATAASPSSRRHDFEAVEAAYFPWIDALCTLLDSLVDQEADARTGDFSFMSHYSSPSHARVRLGVIADRALKETHSLPAASRHGALMCAVVGMYLSPPSARVPRIQPVAESVLDATAPLSRWACAVLGAQRRALGSASVVITD